MREKIPFNPTLILCECDDWEGIYINGKLDYEGHRIHNGVWIDLIKKYGAFSQKVESYWVSEDYLHDRGNLPDKFEDIPKEMLS
jgi:hypothetical protein